MSNSVVTLTNSVAGVDTIGAEISQIIELATGRAPTGLQLANWEAYQEAGGSLASIASAFVASSAFADSYNHGVLVAPNAPINASIATSIIDYALGSHSTAQVNAWVASGLPVAQVFQAFALNDQFASLEAPLNDGLTVLESSVSGELVGPTSSSSGISPAGISTSTANFGSGGPSGVSSAGFSIPILHLGPGESIYFDNATTETLANINGSSEVDVSSATSLTQSLDMAAARASASQPGGLIPADTGVFDWFQYGGNTYLVEAINPTSTPETQTELTATDAAVEIVGSIDMAGLEMLGGHSITL
jgi:hypothetical protein